MTDFHQEELRAIFDTVLDAIFVTDLSGGIIRANPAAERLFGYPVDQLLGMSAADFIHTQERQRAISDFRRTLKEGVLAPVTYRCIGNAAREFPVEISAAALRDREGRPVGTIGTAKDITDRKIAEEERQRAARLESTGVLAGGIAHDFNNILAAVLSNLTLAETNLDHPEDAAHRLSLAKEALSKARGLTDQLLTFSTGGDPIRAAANMAQLLEETALFVLHGADVTAHFDIPDELWAVECDKGQIGRVVSNLVINSIQACPPGGNISIAARNLQLSEGNSKGLPEGRYVRIDVIDEGTGIPSDILHLVFDPFFTTRPGGSGLGLATAYSIVTKHGGHIAAESSPGQGATVTILLPATARRPISEQATSEALIMGSGRVLIMDDEPAILEALAALLAQLGYEAHIAKNGERAVELYRQAQNKNRSYDAVILDLTVPGAMGGLETLAQLCTIDPGVKAIVSSGYSTDPVMSDPKKYGFCAVLKKPYRFSVLGRIVKTVVDA